MAWADLANDWDAVSQIAAVVYDTAQSIKGNLSPQDLFNQLNTNLQTATAIFNQNTNLDSTFQSDVLADLDLSNYSGNYDCSYPGVDQQIGGTIKNVATNVSPLGSIAPIQSSFQFNTSWNSVAQEGYHLPALDWISTEDFIGYLQYLNGQYLNNSSAEGYFTNSTGTLFGVLYTGGSTIDPQMLISVSGKINTLPCTLSSLDTSNSKVDQLISKYF